MNTLQEVIGSLATKPKSSENSNKKRKWREIEQLKEKFQLEKELKAYEGSLDYILEEF
jgi:hypothetical protein